MSPNPVHRSAWKWTASGKIYQEFGMKWKKSGIRPVGKVRSPERCSVEFSGWLHIRASTAVKSEGSHHTSWGLIRQRAKGNNAGFGYFWDGRAREVLAGGVQVSDGGSACAWYVIPQRACGACDWFQPMVTWWGQYLIPLVSTAVF